MGRITKLAKINLKLKSSYAYILHTVISRLHVFFLLFQHDDDIAH